MSLGHCFDVGLPVPVTVTRSTCLGYAHCNHHNVQIRVHTGPRTHNYVRGMSSYSFRNNFRGKYCFGLGSCMGASWEHHGNIMGYAVNGMCILFYSVRLSER